MRPSSTGSHPHTQGPFRGCPHPAPPRALTPPAPSTARGFPMKGKGHPLCTLCLVPRALGSALECPGNPSSTRVPQSTLQAPRAGTGLWDHLCSLPCPQGPPKSWEDPWGGVGQRGRMFSPHLVRPPGPSIPALNPPLPSDASFHQRSFHPPHPGQVGKLRHSKGQDLPTGISESQLEWGVPWLARPLYPWPIPPHPATSRLKALDAEPASRPKAAGETRPGSLLYQVSAEPWPLQEAFLMPEFPTTPPAPSPSDPGVLLVPCLPTSPLECKFRGRSSVSILAGRRRAGLQSQHHHSCAHSSLAVHSLIQHPVVQARLSSGRQTH